MSSPFASRVVKTLPIPFDPPNEVTLQKLAGRHLERAQLDAQVKFIESVTAKGGFERQKEAMEFFEQRFAQKSEVTDNEDKAIDVAVASNPLAGYDPYTVCRFGIKSWSYDIPVTEESVNDLGDEAAIWFATEIMRLTKPRLFETAEQRKESEKNDSAASLIH